MVKALPLPPPTTSASLTSDKTAPPLVGTPVTFTAQASGGTPPYQYEWLLHDGTSWTIPPTWSSSNTFTWTPTTVNPNYRVGVWVHRSGSPVDVPDDGTPIPCSITAGGTPTISDLQ